MSGRGARKRFDWTFNGPAHVFHYDNYAYCYDYLALTLIKAEGAFSPAVKTERLRWNASRPRPAILRNKRPEKSLNEYPPALRHHSVISSSRQNEAGQQQKQTKRLWCRCKVQ